MNKSIYLFILAGIIVTAGTGVLVSEAQCTACQTQPGEMAIMWWGDVRDHQEFFQVEVQFKAANGDIVISDIFDMVVNTSTSGAAVGTTNGASGWPGIPFNGLTQPGPYTTTIVPIDPNHTWTATSFHCANRLAGGIYPGTFDGDLSITNIPFTDGMVLGCSFTLITTENLPTQNVDTITENLDEIVLALEGKDRQIQILIDKQVGHDDAVASLNNFMLTIDGEKIKFKELELTVDQMITSLELILQELLAL